MDEHLLPGSTDDPQRRIEDLLADPAVRARVAVTILAFFVSSNQDQLDRFESRRIVSRYAELSKQFLHEGHFGLAEQAVERLRQRESVPRRRRP